MLPSDTATGTGESASPIHEGDETSQPQDNCPIFSPRAPAPDPALVAAISEQRRAAYVQDGGTLGPTDKVTDVSDLQRQIDTINKLRGPHQQVSDAERSAMEEKLLKLSQGQWYIDVVQRARESGKDTVSLKDFQKMVEERDIIPIDTFRNVLKTNFGTDEQREREKALQAEIDRLKASPPSDKADELGKNLAASKQAIATLQDLSVKARERCNDEKTQLQSEIDQLKQEAAEKDSVGKNKRLKILKEHNEELEEKNQKLEADLQTANEALKNAVNKLILAHKENPQLQQKEDATQALEAQLKEKSQQVEKANEVIRTRNKTIKDLKQIIDSKKQDIRIKEEECAQKLDQQSKQKDAKVETLTAEIKKVREHLSAAERTIKAVTSIDDTLRKDFESLEDDYDKMMGEVDIATEAKKKAEAGKLNLQKDNREKDKLIQQLSKRLEDCERHLQDPQAATIEGSEASNLEKVQNEPDEKGTDSVDLTDKIRQKDMEIAELKEKLKDCEEHRQRIGDSEVTGQAGEKRNINAQGTQTDVEAISVNDRKDGEVQELREALRQCQEHDRKLQDDLDSFYLRQQPLESKGADATQAEEMAKQKQLLAWGQQRAAEFKAEIASLLGDKGELTLRLREAEDRLVARAHSQTSENTPAEPDAVALLKSQLESCRKRVDDLEAEKGRLEAKVKKLDVHMRASVPRNQFDKLKTARDEGVELLLKIQNTLKEYLVQGEGFKARIDSLEKEKSELTEKLQGAQSQLKALQSAPKPSQTDGHMHKINKTLNKQLEERTVALEECNEALSTLREEAVDQAKMLQDITTQLEQCKKHGAELEKKLAFLEEDNSVLGASLDAAREEAANARSSADGGGENPEIEKLKALLVESEQKSSAVILELTQAIEEHGLGGRGQEEDNNFEMDMEKALVSGRADRGQERTCTDLQNRRSKQTWRQLGRRGTKPTTS